MEKHQSLQKTGKFGQQTKLQLLSGSPACLSTLQTSYLPSLYNHGANSLKFTNFQTLSCLSAFLYLYGCVCVHVSTYVHARTHAHTLTS